MIDSQTMNAKEIAFSSLHLGLQLFLIQKDTYDTLHSLQKKQPLGSPELHLIKHLRNFC